MQLIVDQRRQAGLRNLRVRFHIIGSIKKLAGIAPQRPAIFQEMFCRSHPGNMHFRVLRLIPVAVEMFGAVDRFNLCGVINAKVSGNAGPWINIQYGRQGVPSWGCNHSSPACKTITMMSAVQDSFTSDKMDGSIYPEQITSHHLVCDIGQFF